MTWVEHVEVDDRGVHNLYKQLVSSGHGFGAKRWVATLDRQCERLASAMATNIPAGDVGGNKYYYITVLLETIMHVRVLILKLMIDIFVNMKMFSHNKSRRKEEYVETG